MNRDIILGIGAIILFSFLFSGCGPSRLEMDYGTSFKLQKFNQTLDPEAEKNLEVVKGLDGNAAAAIAGQYQKGFTKAENGDVYNISIGGGGGMK